jgi:hypothetical protein
MQLSPNEAIVMISGVHPVRARKARYFEDPQLQHRILKPSGAVPIDWVARPDEWSRQAPIRPSIKFLFALTNKARDQNSGIRREPDLPQHEDVVVKALVAEAALASFLSPDDSDRREAAIAKRLDRIVRVLERLERNDGITLETIALFIRFWLTSTPALPEHSSPAARAKGADRYDRFVEALGRRLSSGSTVLKEVSIELAEVGSAAQAKGPADLREDDAISRRIAPG